MRYLRVPVEDIGVMAMSQAIDYDFPFGRPNVLDGLASVFDFSGTIRHHGISSDPLHNDAEALRGDMLAVGNDVFTAVKVIANEEKRNPKTSG